MLATSLRIAASRGPDAFTPGSEMEVMGPSMMIFLERQVRDRLYCRMGLCIACACNIGMMPFECLLSIELLNGCERRSQGQVIVIRYR